MTRNQAGEGAFIHTHKIWRILTFILVVCSLIWVVQTEWFSIFKSGDIEQIQLMLEEEIYFLLLLTFSLMLIQNLFTLIPIVGIIVINIALFGLVCGYIWSLATSLIGALVAFVVFRYWFQSLLINKVKKSYLEKLEQNGVFFVLLLRLIPFVPSSLINITGGVSSIRLMPFLTATFIGNTLYLLLLSFVANGLLSADIEGYMLVALLVAILPSIYLYRYLKKKSGLGENEKRKVRGG